MSETINQEDVQDDMVLPFQVETTGVRGRIVRLGPLVDDILNRHDYPEPVSRLLGEALALTALLGEALKFEGTLTIQAQGDGVVSVMVTSFTTPGGLRGFAQIDQSAYGEALKGDLNPSSVDLLGKGHLALTIDPEGDMKRYQGIVALHGESLAEAAHEYFRQSEQIATLVKLSVGRVKTADNDGQWRAGGLMIQHLAVEGGHQDEKEREARLKSEDGIAVLTPGGEDVEEAWARASALTETTEDHEMLDPLLSPEQLLYRLFHEDGVRVYDPLPLKRVCKCSSEKSQDLLKSFVDQDITSMVVNGRVEVTCEFCSSTYLFDPETLDQIEG